MRRLFGPVAALLVALTPSCLGGQTGQPDSTAHCETHPLAAGTTWHGRTAEELAAAFAGAHRASLAWQEEEWTSEYKTPVAFEDAITITISPASTSDTAVNCYDALDIAVEVEIATSESGLNDHGIGTLTLRNVESVLTAQLSFDGGELTLQADLTQTDAAVAPQGHVIPRAAGAPGGSAAIR